MSEILIDNYNRQISYLRISVTSDCNLQCLYCNPGHEKVKNSLLGFDEITKIVSAAAEIGITKIRITGGEPLLRKNLSILINRISKIDGIADIAITTNGHLLSDLASELRLAGLNRLNISLDSLIPEIYKKINGGNIENILHGISTAKKYFDKIRINMVVIKGVNDNEAESFIEFGKKENLTVRFLELMPNKNPPESPFSRWNRDKIQGGLNSTLNKREMFLSNEILISNLHKKYKLERLSSKEKSGSAEWFLVDNGPQKIGFISPVSKPFCSDCNRIRLTSDGELIPCLHGEERISLREVLAENDDEEIIKRIKYAATKKIPVHKLNEGKTFCEMKIIGG